MDATTKERADCSPATPLNTASLDALSGSLAERQALVAELIVRAGLPYEPGGRGVDGAGVDGFGFLRLAVMAATGRQLADLFGYQDWPQREPNPQRVANLLDDWGMSQVGRHDYRAYRRGDVVIYLGLDGPAGGPAGDIVISPGNHDRAALVASCWAAKGPAIEPMRARLQRHQARVYRWVEA